MKKYVKTIIIVSVLALMCIGYFFYLSNRKSTKDATDKSVGNQEVAALTTKDIDKKRTVELLTSTVRFLHLFVYP